MIDRRPKLDESLLEWARRLLASWRESRARRAQVLRCLACGEPAAGLCAACQAPTCARCSAVSGETGSAVALCSSCAPARTAPRTLATLRANPARVFASGVRGVVFLLVLVAGWAGATRGIAGLEALGRALVHPATLFAIAPLAYVLGALLELIPGRAARPSD